MRTRPLPMTPHRQRMVEDMHMRTYSEHTMRAYLHCIADFARHFRTSPAHLGPEQVRAYQLFLVQAKPLAWPTVVQTVCALRFLYRVTLGRPMMLDSIPHPRRPFTLPTILSQAEVAVLLTTPRNLKHRAILPTL
jgi:integrase/recombinase XerD